jgi:hypothetical protein
MKDGECFDINNIDSKDVHEQISGPGMSSTDWSAGICLHECEARKASHIPISERFYAAEKRDVAGEMPAV